jgi:hypothetical protein
MDTSAKAGKYLMGSKVWRHIYCQLGAADQRFFKHADSGASQP